MGYIRHHAIVVTGSRWTIDVGPNHDIEDAHQAAVEAGCPVSPIVDGRTNSYASFLVAPDGSKEGWDTSDEGDRARDRFIAWLRENGAGGYFSWAEVVLGSDDSEALIERNAWDDEDSASDEDR